ncbi:MAG: DUF4340 domain-containing protein, partial [Pseudobdellovibrionaceae bacterium]
EIQIIKSNEKVFLKRAATGWDIIEPIQDSADNTFVENFLEQISKEKYFEIAKEESKEVAVDWSVYGLDKPKAEIKFTTSAQKSQSFFVSEKKNFEDHGYLKMEGDNKVYVVAADWLTRADRGALDFRDKKIFRKKPASIDAINIKNKNGSFELKLDKINWLISDEADWLVDQNKSREILQNLTDARVMEFLDASKSNNSEFGLNNKHLQLKVKINNQPEWTLQVGQGKDKSYYALISEPRFFVKVEPGSLDKLLKIKKSDLRDKKKPFDFKKEQVQQVDLLTSLKTMSFMKKSNIWSLMGDGNEKIKINQNGLSDLVTKLKDAEVYEYIDQKKDFTLSNKITLRDEKQNVVFRLEWGNSETRKVNDLPKKLLVAKSSLLDQYFYIEESKINDLQLKDLTSVENVSKTSPQPAPTKK